MYSCELRRSTILLCCVFKTVYDTKFFTSLSERAFKVMKNGMYSIVIAFFYKFYLFWESSSSSALFNSLRVSCNSAAKFSFSSLHVTLMHLGGLCIFGCFPPKRGCWTVFLPDVSVKEIQSAAGSDS